MKKYLILLICAMFTAAFSGYGELAQPVNTVKTERNLNVRDSIENSIKKEIEFLRNYQKVLTVLNSVKTNLTEKEKKDVARIIAEKSMEYGFSVEFVLAVIQTESSFNKYATSKVGAIGLMQLMPITGKAIAKDFGIVIKDKKHLYNPQLNVTLGMYYLKKLSDRFKDMNLVLAAYNMGETALRKYKHKKDLAAYRYAKVVLKRHKKFYKNLNEVNWYNAE